MMKINVNDMLKGKRDIGLMGKGGVSLMGKRGVSLMISYVILISIAMIMAITIYGWLTLVSNVEPLESCEDKTSLIIEKVECLEADKIFKVNVGNNGRFSVNGFIISVGDNVDRVPIESLIPIPASSSVPAFPGRYTFSVPLKPGESIDARFDNSIKTDSGIGDIDFIIKHIRIQPFIISEGNLVLCESGVIREVVQDCDIRPSP